MWRKTGQLCGSLRYPGSHYALSSLQNADNFLFLYITKCCVNPLCCVHMREKFKTVAKMVFKRRIFISAIRDDNFSISILVNHCSYSFDQSLAEWAFFVHMYTTHTHTHSLTHSLLEQWQPNRGLNHVPTLFPYVLSFWQHPKRSTICLCKNLLGKILFCLNFFGS